MKEEMKHMLQHIWEVFGYLDNEVEHYADRNEITIEEVLELYHVFHFFLRITCHIKQPYELREDAH